MYILLLAIVLGLAYYFSRTYLKPFLQKNFQQNQKSVTKNVETQVDEQFMQSEIERLTELVKRQNKIIQDLLTNNQPVFVENNSCIALKSKNDNLIECSKQEKKEQFDEKISESESQSSEESCCQNENKNSNDENKNDSNDENKNDSDNENKNDSDDENKNDSDDENKNDSDNENKNDSNENQKKNKNDKNYLFNDDSILKPFVEYSSMKQLKEFADKHNVKYPASITKQKLYTMISQKIVIEQQ